MAMWKTRGDAADQASHDDGDIQAALHTGDLRRALTLMMRCYGDEVYRFAYAQRSPVRKNITRSAWRTRLYKSQTPPS